MDCRFLASYYEIYRSTNFSALSEAAEKQTLVLANETECDLSAPLEAGSVEECIISVDFVGT